MLTQNEKYIKLVILKEKKSLTHFGFIQQNNFEIYRFNKVWPLNWLPIKWLLIGMICAVLKIGTN